MEVLSERCVRACASAARFETVDILKAYLQIQYQGLFGPGVFGSVLLSVY